MERSMHENRDSETRKWGHPKEEVVERGTMS
jgi:hypothetical protein